MSRLIATGSTEGRWRHRLSSGSAARPGCRSGRSSATRRPALVIVMSSPRDARSTTSPPLLRRSRMLTSVIAINVSRVIQSPARSLALAPCPCARRASHGNRRDSRSMWQRCGPSHGNPGSGPSRPCRSPAGRTVSTPWVLIARLQGSQASGRGFPAACRRLAWARLGSNQRPLACEASALPLSYAPSGLSDASARERGGRRGAGGSVSGGRPGRAAAPARASTGRAPPA